MPTCNHPGDDRMLTLGLLSQTTILPRRGIGGKYLPGRGCLATLASGWLGQSRSRIARPRSSGAPRPSLCEHSRFRDAPERAALGASSYALPQPPVRNQLEPEANRAPVRNLLTAKDFFGDNWAVKEAGPQDAYRPGDHHNRKPAKTKAGA